MTERAISNAQVLFAELSKTFVDAITGVSQNMTDQEGKAWLSQTLEQAIGNVLKLAQEESSAGELLRGAIIERFADAQSARYN